MRIQELLRQDFANYIRPAFIGCKCEKCGKSKQLELHHVYRFYDMLKDTLEEFNLEYKENSLDYSDDEIFKVLIYLLDPFTRCVRAKFHGTNKQRVEQARRFIKRTAKKLMSRELSFVKKGSLVLIGLFPDLMYRAAIRFRSQLEKFL